MKSAVRVRARRARKTVSRKARNAYRDLGAILRSPRYASKVFCIGYNKTGTTSVGKSLAMLGFRHTSFNSRVWSKYYANNQIIKILNYASKFDSFDDLPWLKEDMIPILDRVFPQSKFIYLTREDESWKKSFYRWRHKVFGVYPDMNVAFEEYCQHKEFVLNYFKERSSDEFLVLDVKDAKGFRKLANFVGKDTSRDAFPHFNRT